MGGSATCCGDDARQGQVRGGLFGCQSRGNRRGECVGADDFARKSIAASGGAKTEGVLGSGAAPVSTGLKGTGARPRARARASRPTPTVVLPTAVSVPMRKMPWRAAVAAPACGGVERGAGRVGKDSEVASAMAAAVASTRRSIWSGVMESGGMRTTTEPRGRKMTPWRRTIRQTRAPMASCGE